MKIRLVTHMLGGTLLIPQNVIDTLKWKLGDEVSLEIVVDRKGESSHLVIESLKR